MSALRDFVHRYDPTGGYVIGAAIGVGILIGAFLAVAVGSAVYNFVAPRFYGRQG